MLKKLRIKMICILMAAVTILLCSTFFLVITTTRYNLEADSLALLYRVVESSDHFIPFGGGPNLPKVPCFVIEKTLSGTTVMGTGYYDLSDQEFLTDVLTQVTASAGDTGVLEGHDLRYLRISDPTKLTIACIDTSQDQSAIHTLARSCTFLCLAALGVFFGISVLLARWAVKPVDEAWQQQKQFIADASHELKTPLTVILTNAELMQDPAQDDLARKRSVDSILAMSHQMRGLVESLLELARMDQASKKYPHTSMDLSQCVAEAVLPFEALFFEQEMLLDVKIEENIFVKGYAPQLQQVLDIFLDNAMKYSIPKGRVYVTLARHGHSCVLTVANEGPAISADDLRHIFRRFYRVDEARQMNRSYGLGLSIAESIVHEHRGKI